MESNTWLGTTETIITVRPHFGELWAIFFFFLESEDNISTNFLKTQEEEVKIFQMPKFISNLKTDL